MSDDCSCGTYCEHGFALSPLEYVKANGFIDFPRAWMIARRTAPEYHHNECSFNTTGGALLCDCDVLTKSPEYVLAYGRDPLEGPPDGGCGGCGNWPEHCVCLTNGEGV